MSHHDVRAGIQQAKVGDTGWGVIAFEALVIAWIAGVRAQSWAVGIAAFLGVIFLVRAAAVAGPSFSNALALVIGGAWGFAALYLAQGAKLGTALMIALLAGLIGTGAHVAGFQYLRDINRATDGCPGA